MELGIRWATEFDAELVGLGVVDEPAICAPEAVPIGAGYFKVNRDQSLLAEARCTVDALLSEFTQTAGAVRHRAIRYDDSPCAALLRQAQSHDLVLLGQQTRFCAENGDILSNVLPALLRNGPAPVVAVPSKLREGRGPCDRL